MKTCLKIFTEEELERIWKERIDLYGHFALHEHPITMTDFDDYGVSAYWNYRTENEIRSGTYDVEMPWSEIADELGYDRMEYAHNEDGDNIALAYNED